jgi:hypothetical protein
MIIMTSLIDNIYFSLKIEIKKKQSKNKIKGKWISMYVHLKLKKNCRYLMECCLMSLKMFGSFFFGWKCFEIIYINI